MEESDLSKKIELAIYVIDLKISDLIRSAKSYQVLQDSITLLKKEKEQIYNQDEETLNKVLTQYLNDVRRQ